MDLEVISYLFALILGVVCYTLVKHTADEYDRWYEQPRFHALALKVPAAAVSVLVVVVAALVLSR
jgi:heme/copper-type cytochrome/quinol oxidase subunit 2